MRRGDGERRYAGYTEVGSHRLLLALLDRDALAVYRRAVLQPLLEHDRHSPVSLVTTMRAFFAAGQQSAAAARELGIHVNTLKHRLSLVEKLTGRDLRSTADVADLYLAMVQE
jgi:DNA-binding PucR family transcriptional regulator